MTGIEKAIKAAGGQCALARLLGLRQSHIWNWLRREGRIPPKRILAVERVTGVSRHELDPSLYPPEVAKP